MAHQSQQLPDEEEYVLRCANSREVYQMYPNSPRKRRVICRLQYRKAVQRIKKRGGVRNRG